MLNSKKCAVIGCGLVGSTSAFALMGSGLFSEIVMLDVNRKRAQGEAMDLNHGMPFAQPVEIHAGDYADVAGAALVVIAAGVAQKPGETRLDLAQKNIAVFREIIGEIVKVNTDCVLLVVTNPVDVLTYAAWKLSGFPAQRVLGSGTVLDTARLKYLLGEHYDIDPRNVHAMVVGEHGDTELPLWSTANVGGLPLDVWCTACGRGAEQRELDRIFEDVRNSAYRIIEGKGATYYAVAMAVLRIAQAVVRGENAVLTVSSLLQGQYGQRDVCLGLPAIVGRGGVQRLLDVPLTAQEQAKLQVSADAVRAVIEGRL